jgi:hypothetical protein
MGTDKVEETICRFYARSNSLQVRLSFRISVHLITLWLPSSTGIWHWVDSPKVDIHEESQILGPPRCRYAKTTVVTSHSMHSSIYNPRVDNPPNQGSEDATNELST